MIIVCRSDVSQDGEKYQSMLFDLVSFRGEHGISVYGALKIMVPINFFNCTLHNFRFSLVGQRSYRPSIWSILERKKKHVIGFSCCYIITIIILCVVYIVWNLGLRHIFFIIILFIYFIIMGSTPLIKIKERRKWKVKINKQDGIHL